MKTPLRQLDTGRVSLEVKVQPGTRKNAVLDLWNEKLRVAVHVPPEGGRANRELVDLLAEFFGIRRNQISLLRGEKSREKVLLIEGGNMEALQKRVDSLHKQ